MNFSINLYIEKISGQPSTVSKAALFQQWMNLMSRIKSVEEIPTIYSDAKQLAKDYQTAKMKVNQAFETNGLGSWIVIIYFIKENSPMTFLFVFRGNLLNTNNSMYPYSLKLFCDKNFTSICVFFNE